MDISDEELEETHSDINKDTEILKVITKSNLPLDISISDQMEDTVALP